MGTRGPVPKRSTERRRRNKDAKAESVEPIVETVAAPEADPNWHPIALRWYESLKDSGQARFFEPSDWAAAQYVAESMSKNLKQRKFSSVLFAAVWSAMSDLLTTEASRRRVRMEIEREQRSAGQSASVTAIDDYKQMLAGSHGRRS